MVGELQAEAKALRQWNFRVARSHGIRIPTAYCLRDSRANHGRAQTAKPQDILDVAMHGGIGDHIEALSLPLPWAKAQNLL